MNTIEKVKERPILFSTAMVQAILEGRKTVTRRVIKPQPEISPDGDIRFPWATFYSTGVVFTFDEDGNGGQNWTGTDFPKEDRFKEALARTEYKNPCPYGKAGDIIYVREMYYDYGYWDENGFTKTGRRKYKFVSLGDPNERRYFDNPPSEVKPSNYRKIAWYKRLARFMPYRYVRLKLEIVSIKVERLQDITEEDAIREGIEPELFDDGTDWGVTRLFKNYEIDGKYEESPVDSFQSLWQSINGAESWEANPWTWRIEFSALRTQKEETK